MSTFKKDVFGKGGMLHELFGEGYELREQQMNMSVACAKAVLDKTVLLAEGATGVGKSFAYLVASVSPSIREQLGYSPIVISTSTKVLQDQLWQKDVPAILAATHQESLRVVLVKGRNNYLSVRRASEYLNDVKNDKVQFDSAEVAESAVPLLEKPLRDDGAWDGEFSNFEEVIPSEIRLEIESTDKDCHGESCSCFSRCPYYAARERRKKADILIVNHALLALHIQNKNILPERCRTFIVDEAHKFFDAVSSTFELEITLRQVQWFLKTFRTRLGKLRESFESDARKSAILSDFLNTLERRRRKDDGIAGAFFDEAEPSVREAAIREGVCREENTRFGYAVLTPELDGHALASVFLEYTALCQNLMVDLDMSEGSEDEATLYIKDIRRSAFEISNRFDSVMSRSDSQRWCYWTDVCASDGGIDAYRLTLKRTPIDISEQIAPLFDGKSAVIFTSATLQVAESFGRIRHQLGRTNDPTVQERVYPSPFPYKENVEIHLFNDVLLDRPYHNASAEKKEAYWQQQTRLVEYYLRLRGGRALVLCASNQLLYELSERLEDVLSVLGITVLKQHGTDRLKETVAAFKADETSVLFGVASCWEGLDAPGSTLETVIIPQLPFAPPHPLLEARKALLEHPDEDWFGEISLPDMLLHLKQGAGRLVRSSTDRGVIAILSPRPLTKAYGRDIIRSLPRGKIVRNPPDALKAINP